MSKNSKKFNEYLLNKLKDADYASEYLNAALSEYLEDHDIKMFLKAVTNVAMAKSSSVSELAQKTSINRQHLYTLFTEPGCPHIDTLFSLIDAAGYKFKAIPKDKDCVCQ